MGVGDEKSFDGGSGVFSTQLEPGLIVCPGDLHGLALVSIMKERSDGESEGKAQ
jgi:hypothetical protein